jgi:hypothetical protein
MPLRTLCASILITTVLAPVAFGQEGLDAVDNCIKRLDPQTDVGYVRIAARCPDLAQRLQASSWAAWLPKDWQASSSDLSAGSLKELRELVARELATRTTRRAPSLAPLTVILAELGPMEDHNRGLWARFTRWLREALERGDPSPARDWLEVPPSGLSQAVIDLICYACLAAVVVMAMVIILNELREAGVFAARRTARKARHRPELNVRPDWAAIQKAPARDRPRLLLELIAIRLMELNRLPPAAGFTVHELLRKARLVEAEDQALLADVALAAERVRFSQEQIPGASLEAVVERGRRVLEHLEA